MKHFIFFFIISIIGIGTLQAQTLAPDQSPDFGGWLGPVISHSFKSGNSLTFHPIFRYNQDFSNHVNTFLDLSYSQKIDGKTRFVILNRSIVKKGQPYQNWIFFDLIRKDSIASKFDFQNRLRYHWGLKLNGIKPADLIRYEPKLIYKPTKELSFFTGIDFSYRIDNDDEHFRNRYELGGSVKFAKMLNFSLSLWYDDFTRVTNRRDIYLIISSIGIKL